MQGEPRSAARDAALARRFAAAVRHVAAQPASPTNDVRRVALGALCGEIGAVPAEPFPGIPSDVALSAAGVLGVLQYDVESFAVLVRFPPDARTLSLALRVIPRLPRTTALAHRSWILAMVGALGRCDARDRLGSFVRALQRAGHLELVETIRGSGAAEHIGPVDRWVLDAETACWAGAYDALREHVEEAPSDEAIADDVGLFAAITHAAAGDTRRAFAAAAAMCARGTPQLRDVASRWKAEWALRLEADGPSRPQSSRSRPDTVHAPRRPSGERGAMQALRDAANEAELLEAIARGTPAATTSALAAVKTWWRSRRDSSGRPPEAIATAALREVTDHPVVRLLAWIAVLRQQREGDGSREALRDFHEWVIAGLQRADVPGIAALADEWRRGGDEATLWKMIALFGGNRGDACTVLQDGRLRAIDLRTARQESVAMQRRLRHVGLDAVVRAFAALAAEWPRLVVFRTYSAELLLWAGRYEEAASVFDDVRHTSFSRWAHIGLGAALAALGKTAAAERVWDEELRVHHGAQPGEASLVYRAEVAIGAGRLDVAAALARQVLRAKPTRLRAYLVAAELAWLRRDAAEGRAALLRAATMCPGLADADGPLALAGSLLDPASGRGRDDAIARCRSLRAAMRGNASSWLFTWHDRAGAMHAFVGARAQGMETALDYLERI